MKIYIVIAVVVVVAAGGWFFYNSKTEINASSTNISPTQTTQEDDAKADAYLKHATDPKVNPVFNSGSKN